MNKTTLLLLSCFLALVPVARAKELPSIETDATSSGDIDLKVIGASVGQGSVDVGGILKEFRREREKDAKRQVLAQAVDRAAIERQGEMESRAAASAAYAEREMQYRTPASGPSREDLERQGEMQSRAAASAAYAEREMRYREPAPGPSREDLERQGEMQSRAAASAAYAERELRRR